MKKSIKFLAVVAIASMTMVACNNNAPAEEVVDSAAIEQIVPEETIAEPAEVLDTTPVVEEQKAAATTTTKKPATKKTVAPAKKAEEAAPAAKVNTEKVATTTESTSKKVKPATL